MIVGMIKKIEMNTVIDGGMTGMIELTGEGMEGEEMTRMTEVTSVGKSEVTVEMIGMTEVTGEGMTEVIGEKMTEMMKVTERMT